MSLLWGTALGMGLLLIWWSWWPRRPVRIRGGLRRPGRLRRLLAEAGHRRVGVSGVVTAIVACALVAFLLVMLLTAAVPVALCFALFAAAVPVVVLRWQAARRRAMLREIWPDVVDHLRSAVRAGMSLPEAIMQSRMSSRRMMK
ncbi:type II secretion system F family protein [Nesterenkonia suensis]